MSTASNRLKFFSLNESMLRESVEQYLRSRASNILKNPLFQHAAACGALDESWWDIATMSDEPDQMQKPMSKDDMLKMFADNLIRSNPQGVVKDKAIRVSYDDIHSDAVDKEMQDAIKKEFGCDITQLLAKSEE